MEKYKKPKVPNNSYHFWADLPLEGMADIQKYWFKLLKLPSISTRFSWAKSHNFFIMENQKLKIRGL